MVIFDVGVLGPLTLEYIELYQARMTDLLPMVGVTWLCFCGKLGPVIVKLVFLCIQVRVTQFVWESTVSHKTLVLTIRW